MTMINSEIGYLMGRIFAKGQIDRSHVFTQVTVKLPYQSIRINGKDLRLYADTRLLGIQQRIQPLVDNLLNINSGAYFHSIYFSKNSRDFLENPRILQIVLPEN